MFKSMKLKTKLIVTGIIMTLTPLMIVSAVTFIGNQKMIEVTSQSITELAYADLDHMAENVYGMCANQAEFLQQHMERCLSAAHEILLGRNEVSEVVETASWDAINQYSQVSTNIKVPKMMVNGEWLGQNTDITQTSPIVDEVYRMTGATCTIFQRMNSTGDMLRVCTNVKTNDGKRAIGTYIPRTNPDGQPNPVVSSVLNGQKFSGRSGRNIFKP